MKFFFSPSTLSPHFSLYLSLAPSLFCVNAGLGKCFSGWEIILKMIFFCVCNITHRNFLSLARLFLSPLFFLLMDVHKGRDEEKKTRIMVNKRKKLFFHSFFTESERERECRERERKTSAIISVCSVMKEQVALKRRVTVVAIGKRKKKVMFVVRLVKKEEIFPLLISEIYGPLFFFPSFF